MGNLAEGVMKKHIAPHTVVVRNREDLLHLEDRIAQTDFRKDQSVEFQHRSYRVLSRENKQEQTILSSWPPKGPPPAVES